MSSLASTPDVVSLVADADLAVVLHEEASVPLATVSVPAAGRVVVVVNVDRRRRRSLRAAGADRRWR